MDVTDEIKARIDMVDFVSRYVPLKRAGRSYKALCPFHQENTPSFVVFPDTGTWRCFGACGTGGDIFSFVMQHEGLDFREALQMLARETGVELETEQDSSDSRERTRLYEANALAAQYFRDILHRHPDGQPARAYLAQRGIDASAAEQFQLGFALNSWDALGDYLNQQGYADEELHAAGLLKHNEDRGSYYDAFRNRLMIPIADRQGRITGFGGRVLDDAVPKYLNTADTRLFKKSATVYGIDKAYRAIREADEVVIVEGYMDVIAAQQHGHTNVVACLGTALTETQLQQLQRYTNNFILALDADSAGQQATIRGLNQARQALKRTQKPVVTPSGRVQMENRLSANLRIVALPEGRDPDDIIRQDPNRWQELVGSAQPLVDYFVSIVSVQSDLSSAQGKAEAVAELVPLIAELDDDIERQHYTQRLSRLLHIDEQTIAHRVQAAARALMRANDRQHRATKKRTSPVQKQPERLDRPETATDGSTGESIDESTDPSTSGSTYGSIDEKTYEPSSNPGGSSRSRPQSETGLELFLLANLLEKPDLLVWLAGMAEKLQIAPLGSNELQQIEHKEIFLALKRYIASDEPWDLESFQEVLSPDLHGSLANLVQHATDLPERDYMEIQEAVIKAVIRLRQGRLRQDLGAMQFLLLDAQQNGDRDAVFNYSAAINTNRRERYHLEKVLAGLNHVTYGSNNTEQGLRIA